MLTYEVPAVCGPGPARGCCCHPHSTGDTAVALGALPLRGAGEPGPVGSGRRWGDCAPGPLSLPQRGLEEESLLRTLSFVGCGVSFCALATTFLLFLAAR